MGGHGLTAFDAVFEDRLVEMLAKGRRLGWLSPEVVMEVLTPVELSTGLIDGVIARIRADGIEYRDEMSPNDSNTGPVPLVLVAEPRSDSDRGTETVTAQPGSPASSVAAPTSRSEVIRAAPKPRASRDTAVREKKPPAAGSTGNGSTGNGSLSNTARRNVARAVTNFHDDPGSAPSPDPVHAYLKEIGKVPLLQASGEVEVAQRIAAGLRAADNIMRLQEQYAPGPVPRSELDEEFDVLSAGLKAKALLVESNLRLVVSIAKRYRSRGMPLLDLIQEGNLGLIRAVEKFDYTKGFRFSTYATWWIRQAISRAIAEQARTIRIPAHMVEVINRVTRIQRQLSQDRGAEPTVEELALRAELPVERIQEILRINQDPVSIDQPVGDEDDFSLSDVIEDRGATVPPDAAARAMLNEAVNRALADLSDREQEVVRLRFGLDDGQVRTLEEVGKVIGVTRERIRQIEVKTLAKLRHPMRCQPLRDYLDEA